MIHLSPHFPTPVPHCKEGFSCREVLCFGTVLLDKGAGTAPVGISGVCGLLKTPVATKVTEDSTPKCNRRFVFVECMKELYSKERTEILGKVGNDETGDDGQYNSLALLQTRLKTS